MGVLTPFFPLHLRAAQDEVPNTSTTRREISTEFNRLVKFML